MTKSISIIFWFFGLIIIGGESAFANPFDLLKEKSERVAQGVKNGDEAAVIKEFYSEEYYNSLEGISKIFQDLHLEIKDFGVSSKDEMTIYDDYSPIESSFFPEDLTHLYEVHIPLDDGDEFRETLFRVFFVEYGEEDFKAIGFRMNWTTSFNKLALQYADAVQKGKVTFITQNFYSEEALASIPGFENSILEIQELIKDLKIGDEEQIQTQGYIIPVDTAIFGVDSLHIETYSVPMCAYLPSTAPAKYLNISFAAVEEDETVKIAGIQVFKLDYPEDYARRVTQHLIKGEGDSLTQFLSDPESFTESNKQNIINYFERVFSEFRLADGEELFFSKRYDKMGSAPDSIHYTIAHIPLAAKENPKSTPEANLSLYFYHDLNHDDFRLAYFNVEQLLLHQIDLPTLEQFNFKKEDFGLISFLYEDASQTPSFHTETEFEANEFGDDINSFIEHLNTANINSSEIILFDEVDRGLEDKEVISGFLMSNDESFIWIFLRSLDRSVDDEEHFLLFFLKKENPMYAVQYNTEILKKEEFDNLLEKLSGKPQD